MCGIVGVFSSSNDSTPFSAYYALNLLQHRGQDAAGMAVSSGGLVSIHHGHGLVSKVFDQSVLDRLCGHKMALGHVRYPTAMLRKQEDTQPFYVNHPYGITIAHNGNLINAKQLYEFLVDNRRHINTHSDSELLLNLLAYEISLDINLLSTTVVFQAIERLHQKLQGSYAVVGMIPNLGLIAFRDSHGLRPLLMGVKTSMTGQYEYMFASESAPLSAMGYDLVGDVAPGECVIITLDGSVHRKRCTLGHFKHTVCVFEYVYFARPDSIIDGISVYKSRLRMGEYLAKRIQREWADKKIDSVIPVPETSRAAAMAVAQSLQIPLREGFVKNHYIGRTFIAATQKTRQAMVRQKLNALPLEFKGKHILIVDDSIVRGTTSREIIRMAYEAGANKVYLAVASPPVRHPNIYGIDIPTYQELIAHQCSTTEIAKILGVDDLMYQSVDDLIQAVLPPNGTLDIAFDLSCFTGEYVTGNEKHYINQLNQLRQNKPNEDTQTSLI